MFIYFCRIPHLDKTEISDGKNKRELSEIGKEQLIRLQKYFSGKGDLIYFSTDGRAKSCAEKINEGEKKNRIIYENKEEFDEIDINFDEEDFEADFYENNKAKLENTLKEILKISKDKNKDAIILSHHSLIYSILLIFKYMEMHDVKLNNKKIINNFVRFLNTKATKVEKKDSKDEKYEKFNRFQDNLILFPASISKISVSNLHEITIIKYNYIKHIGEISNDYLCPHCSLPLYRTNDPKMLTLFLKDYRKDLNDDAIAEKYSKDFEFYFRCSNYLCKFKRGKDFRKYEGEFPHLTYSPVRLYNENTTLNELFSKRYYSAVAYFLNAVKTNYELSGIGILLDFFVFLELLFTPDPILISVKIGNLFFCISTVGKDSNDCIQNILKKISLKNITDQIEFYDKFNFNLLPKISNGSPFGVSRSETIIVIPLSIEEKNKIYIYVVIPYNKATAENMLNNIKDKSISLSKIISKKYFKSLSEDKLICFFKNYLSSNHQTITEVIQSKRYSKLLAKLSDYNDHIGAVVDNFYKKLHDIHNYKRAWILIKDVKKDKSNFCFKYLLSEKKIDQFKHDTNNLKKAEREKLIKFFANFELPDNGIIGMVSRNYLPEFTVGSWTDPRMSEQESDFLKLSTTDRIMIDTLREIYSAPHDYFVIPIRIRDTVFGVVTVYSRIDEKPEKENINFDNEKYLMKCLSLLSLVKGLSYELEREILTEYFDAVIERICNSDDESINYLRLLNKIFPFLPVINIELNKQKKPEAVSFNPGFDEKYNNEFIGLLKDSFQKINNLKVDESKKSNNVYENTIENIKINLNEGDKILSIYKDGELIFKEYTNVNLVPLKAFLHLIQTANVNNLKNRGNVLYDGNSYEEKPHQLMSKIKLYLKNNLKVTFKKEKGIINSIFECKDHKRGDYLINAEIEIT